MVRETREIKRTVTRRPSCTQYCSMQRHTAERVDRLFDRDSGQLVPERDGMVLGTQHPGREAFIERVQRVAGDRIEQ